MRLLKVSRWGPPGPKPVVSSTPTTWKGVAGADGVPDGVLPGREQHLQDLGPITATLRPSFMSMALR